MAARTVLMIAALIGIVLLVWSLASCAEPRPANECEAPLIMVNSTLECPEPHNEPPHYGQQH